MSGFSSGFSSGFGSGPTYTADSDRLLLENGDVLQLEDGSGGLLLERSSPSGTVALVSDAPTLVVSTSVRLTQAGDLVASSSDPNVRLTQGGNLVASSSSPNVRLTQGGNLVLWRELPVFPPSGTITIVGSVPSAFSPVAVDPPSGQIDLIGQAPTVDISNVKEPPSGEIDLIGQPVTVGLGIAVPSGLITIVSDPPTVIEATPPAVGVRLTQSGDLVLATYPDSDVRLSQAGDLVATSSDPSVNLSQAGDLVATSSDPNVNLSQAGMLVLYVSGREIVPEIGTNFGPLIWAEWRGNDGSEPVWAPVDLADPSTYYRGFKVGKLQNAGLIQRALSDEDGEIQSQQFEIEISDIDTSIRTLLGRTDLARHLVNTPLVLRMISDPDRRLQKVPRTVAIGIVREYRLL